MWHDERDTWRARRRDTRQAPARRLARRGGAQDKQVQKSRRPRGPATHPARHALAARQAAEHQRLVGENVVVGARPAQRARAQQRHEQHRSSARSWAERSQTPGAPGNARARGRHCRRSTRHSAALLAARPAPPPPGFQAVALGSSDEQPASYQPSQIYPHQRARLLPIFFSLPTNSIRERKMRGGGCLAAGGLLLLLYVLAGVLIQVGRSGGRVDVDGAGRHGRGAWRVRARAPAGVGDSRALWWVSSLLSPVLAVRARAAARPHPRLPAQYACVCADAGARRAGPRGGRRVRVRGRAPRGRPAPGGPRGRTTRARGRARPRRRARVRCAAGRTWPRRRCATAGVEPTDPPPVVCALFQRRRVLLGGHLLRERAAKVASGRHRPGTGSLHPSHVRGCPGQRPIPRACLCCACAVPVLCASEHARVRAAHDLVRVWFRLGACGRAGVRACGRAGVRACVCMCACVHARAVSGSMATPSTPTSPEGCQRS